MSQKSKLGTVLGLLTFVLLWGSPTTVQSQQTDLPVIRPRGVPFDAGRFLEIQQQPSAGIAVRAGRLFDPRSGTNLLDQVVLIKGDLITDVGPADRVQIPAGARVIDLSRETVLPGLIDAHVHLFNTPPLPNESQKALRAVNYAWRNMLGGFTTIGDMGSRDTYGSVDLRNAFNEGLIPGPRMQVAGPHLNPGHGVYDAPSTPGPFKHDETTWQLGTNTNSPWLMRQIVREHGRYGVDTVKMYTTDDFSGQGYIKEPDIVWSDGRMNLYPSLTLEEATAAVDEAHMRGLKVTSHSYGGEGLRIALEAGVDLPMHVLVGVTGSPGLDDETIRLFKQPLDNGQQRMVMQTLWDLISPHEIGNEKSPYPTKFTLVEQSFKRLVAEGITQVFGSGVHAGWEGHGTQAMQFRLYVKWGMSPADALRTATSNAAEWLNYDLGDYTGYVEKGRYADIVAVSGDPLQDITEMERIKFVMKGGTVFRNELDADAVPLQLLETTP